MVRQTSALVETAAMERTTMGSAVVTKRRKRKRTTTRMPSISRRLLHL
jgi:hypothetical protein